MKYCLLGETLKHSYSREIHLNRGFDYSLNEISSDMLGKFCADCDYDGFNVTIPYKRAIMPYLAEISVDAKAIGSVNTVKNVGGKLSGYNTDVDGLAYQIARRGVALKGKTVLVLGTGGAGVTAKYYADSVGAKAYFVSRAGEANYENCYDVFPRASVIINATPVGMFPKVSAAPIDVARFRDLEAVFDCVYNPLRSELILQAEERGLICSGGLSMLVKQATEAEKIWQGKDEADVEAIVSRLFFEKSNLVLFGMPSCGKSTVGKRVAKKLHRDFIDTDEEVKTLTGKSPAEIITSDGEEAFRDVESRVIANVSLLSGKIISVGGGAVLRKDNVKALKRNGIALWLKRDLNDLVADGRPLSAAVGIKELYERRKGIYEAAEDCSFVNDGSISEAVRGVIKVYEDTCNKRC